VADIRDCEQCGTTFAPRREHARFCSARCRVTWNRQNAGDRPADASALDWSIIAMRDATERVLRRRTSGGPQAFALISEAVWWVTIVDATLVRYHLDTYNAVLAAQAAPERVMIEGTLAGLRFVRNRMGYYADPADFIQPRQSRSAGSRSEPAGRGAVWTEERGTSDEGKRRQRGGNPEAGGGPEASGRLLPITAWTWRSLPEPALASLPPRGQEWEMARYRAYQGQLRGRTMRETFGRAAGFLRLAADAAR
jgi:hypothetical protein